MRSKQQSFVLVAAVVFFDQFTKYIARKFFPLLVVESPGFFNLFIIAVLLLIFLVLYFRYLANPRNSRGLVLILAGAGSNIIDRIWKGSVTDFINLGITTLNLADLAIVIGILYFILWSKKSIPQR